MKIEIISATEESYWYYNQIGAILIASESEYIDEYDINGIGSVLKSDCRIIEEEKPEPKYRRISFDWDKYKSGIKSIHRNGTEPLRIEYLIESCTDFPIILVTADRGVTFADINGITFAASDNAWDLFLLEEIKPIEKWINISKVGNNMYTSAIMYNSYEDAIEGRKKVTDNFNFIGEPKKFIIYDDAE
jgi:hypothetical protein